MDLRYLANEWCDLTNFSREFCSFSCFGCIFSFYGVTNGEVCFSGLNPLDDVAARVINPLLASR